MNNVFVPLLRISLSNLCIFAIFIFIIFRVVFAAFSRSRPCAIFICELKPEMSAAAAAPTTNFFAVCLSSFIIIIWYFAGAAEDALFYLHFYYIYFFPIHSFALVCSRFLQRQYIRTSGSIIFDYKYTHLMIAIVVICHSTCAHKTRPSSFAFVCNVDSEMIIHIILPRGAPYLYKY